MSPTPIGYSNVDVYVNDTTPQANPVTGVIVRVFSQDGSLMYTQATTDSTGHTGFLLPNNTTFQLRFYKFQVSFSNPQYIQVLPAPATNSFSIPAVLVPPPTTQDQRLCVAFGYFRNGDGSPQSNLKIHFIPIFKPLLVDGNAIMPEQMYRNTDDNGYLEVNLFRCGKYNVTVEGLEDYTLEIAVPDQVNVNLPDLLFPVVNAITFAPPPPAPPAVLSLNVGQSIQLKPTVYLTSGEVDWRGVYDVVWSSDNPAVMGLQLAGGVLTLTGNSPGTANVVAHRAHHRIVRIPDTPIQGVPLPVSVS